MSVGRSVGRLVGRSVGLWVGRSLSRWVCCQSVGMLSVGGVGIWTSGWWVGDRSVGWTMWVGLSLGLCVGGS